MPTEWARLLQATLAAFAMLAALPAAAETDTAQVDVNVEVAPVAYLVFAATNPLLYLEIPPPGSTIPSSGVVFTVYGNATAHLSAEPDAFLLAHDGLQYGKAVLNSSEVGYDIELRFPQIGVVGSPSDIASLPLFATGPAVTDPVNLLATGGQRVGVLHLIANQDWTAHGGLPLAGIHVGEVILTLTADN